MGAAGGGEGGRSEGPPWERRRAGPIRLGSRFAGLPAAPPREPTEVLTEQPIHAVVVIKNHGGPGRGLRVEVTTEVEDGAEAAQLTSLELVIARGSLDQLERHPCPLEAGPAGLVAELPALDVPASLPDEPHLLVAAPMSAVLVATHAGQLHVNIHGRARGPGRMRCTLRFIPAGVDPATDADVHVEHLDIVVRTATGAPLRRRRELHPYELDRLVADDHTFLLLLVDASGGPGSPIDEVRRCARELLAGLRFAGPKGRWSVIASDQPHVLGPEITLQGGLADRKVWSTVEAALASAQHRVNALVTSGPGVATSSRERSGFAVELDRGLGVIAVWLAREHVEHAAAARLLVPAVDALASTGRLVQAVLARWRIDGAGTLTPYEGAVGIDDGELVATRAWAERWVRAVGRGALWLGPALRAHADTHGVDLAAAGWEGRAELGPAVRLDISDIAAAEARLAALLPAAPDQQAHQAARRAGLTSS